MLGGHDGDRDRRELHPVGGGLQSLSSQRKRLLPSVVAQDPVVTDFGKSGRQNVERKPTDKLHAREDQVPDLALLGVVFVTKGDGVGIDGQDAGVGDSNSMGIASEVLEQSIGSDDRPLGKDDPFTLSERMNQLSPRDGLPERFEFAMKLEFSLSVKLNESVDKFGGEHGRDGMDRKEEAGLLRADPDGFPLRVKGKTTPGDEAMKVGMVEEVLPPGVKEGCQTDVSVELIEAKLQESVGSGGKEKGVEKLLVLEEERAKSRRNGKDPVVVTNRE